VCSTTGISLDHETYILRFSRLSAPIETLSRRHIYSLSVYLQRYTLSEEKKWFNVHYEIVEMIQFENEIKKKQSWLRNENVPTIIPPPPPLCRWERVISSLHETAGVHGGTASYATIERYAAASRVNIIRFQNRSIIIKQTRRDGRFPKHAWTNMITSLMWTFRSI